MYVHCWKIVKFRPTLVGRNPSSGWPKIEMRNLLAGNSNRSKFWLEFPTNFLGWPEIFKKSFKKNK